MNKTPQKGEVYAIFQNPQKQTKPEGDAEIVNVLPTNNGGTCDGKTGFLCTVHFLEDAPSETYVRWIYL